MLLPLDDDEDDVDEADFKTYYYDGRILRLRVWMGGMERHASYLFGFENIVELMIIRGPVIDNGVVHHRSMLLLLLTGRLGPFIFLIQVIAAIVIGHCFHQLTRFRLGHLFDDSRSWWCGRFIKTIMMMWLGVCVSRLDSIRVETDSVVK